MASNGIVIQTHERRGIIATAAVNLAEEVGGVIRDDPDLLAEVADLVERPTVLRGQFEDKHLSLPADVLVAVMKKHQRYIPIYSTDGSNLLPYFIAVRNGSSEQLDSVRDGNEHVIRARFADAEFFYNQDTEHRLADFLPDLDTLTFQAELGSMLDKVHRLEKLTPTIAELIGLNSWAGRGCCKGCSSFKGRPGFQPGSRDDLLARNHRRPLCAAFRRIRGCSVCYWRTVRGSQSNSVQGWH